MKGDCQEEEFQKLLKEMEPSEEAMKACTCTSEYVIWKAQDDKHTEAKEKCEKDHADGSPERKTCTCDNAKNAIANCDTFTCEGSVAYPILVTGAKTTWTAVQTT